MKQKMSMLSRLENLVARLVASQKAHQRESPPEGTELWAADLNKCAEWFGGKQGRGYGVVSQNKTQCLAHRKAYELAFGPIPKGLYICHRCDNPGCVNPFHLFAATQKQNLDDMTRKGRRRRVGVKGSKNHASIYAEQDVIEMKRMNSIGTRTCNIWRRFGGSYQSVWLIIRGRNWSHIAVPA